MNGWSEVLREVETAEHGAHLSSLARRAARVASEEGPPIGALQPRIALMGGASLDFLGEPLRVALAAAGIWPELRVAEFGQTLAELLDPNSATASFGPDLVVIAFPSADVAEWPETGCDADDARRKAKHLIARLLEACEAFRDRCGAEIVLDNFIPRPVDSLGNLAASVPSSARSFLRRLNLELSDSAPDFVHVHDVRGLVEESGITRWHDARFWFHAKQPVSFECLPIYVRSLAGVVAGILGRSRKLLVCDLDNTLWGGVIGEDGLDGIELGEGSGAGEAHKALQVYLRELRERGVLLAVCTKNDRAVAELPFREHPEMVLGLDDFVAFEASWGPKSEGIQRIAEELDLGLESIVFLDDNPAERLQVQSFLPGVRVPDLPDDVSEYVEALDRGRHFEAFHVGSEDRRRTEAYRARRSAGDLEAKTGDYDSYLRELEMTALVSPFRPTSMARTAQLVGKTNQFNLTTERLTRSQLEEIASDPLHITRTLHLKDRFGDHGIVSVLLAERVDDALDIRIWLMSCRVLKRRVEELMLDVLADAATRAGASELRGTYVPTDRNGIVCDLYAELGFERVSEENGTTRWRLDLSTHRPLTPPIATE